MNLERAPCGVKADFEPTDDAKDNEFPKSGKEIQSVATTGHVAQPLIVSCRGYGENSPVAKKG